MPAKSSKSGRQPSLFDNETAESPDVASTGSAADYLPQAPTVESLRVAEQECRGCEIYKRATQAVSGEGLVTAQMVLVGETPGDEEDKKGRPFVGPAGALLDQALEAAEIDRANVYVTNVVKHFKWEPHGARRLHAKPSSREIAACRPWLDTELELIKPRVIVCLGATAAQALLGSDFRVTKQRGEILQGSFGNIVATYHPAAVLRATNDEAREEMKRALFDDLRAAAQLLA